MEYETDYESEMESLQRLLHSSTRVEGGSPEHMAMTRRAYDIRRLLMDLNCNFHTHDEIVSLFSAITAATRDRLRRSRVGLRPIAVFGAGQHFYALSPTQRKRTAVVFDRAPHAVAAVPIDGAVESSRTGLLRGGERRRERPIIVRETLLAYYA